MFEYVDADGKNDYNVEASISVNVASGVVRVGVYTGDMDGDSYTIYVPNHRAAILNLATNLMEVLDNTEGWEAGFDGFTTNFASATATPDEDKWSKAGIVSNY